MAVSGAQAAAGDRLGPSTGLAGIRLTQLAACAGCAAKMGPEALAQAVGSLAGLFPRERYPDLLVGLDSPDDAAAYRLSSDTALVVTVDFFPPVVDDPGDYGRIAAANALSDVFAMGGEVLLALNLAAFPDDLDARVVAAILAGGAERVLAAGGVVAGGHTIYDREPKYGLAVVGRVSPERMLKKSGAKAGDRLVLTKPLGTGSITTALRAGRAKPEYVATAVAAMTRLNRAAGRAAVAAGASAATDVTGFGLAGHAIEMARSGGVGLFVELESLPVLPGAVECAAAGFVPGGAGRNRAAFLPEMVIPAEARALAVDLVFDPQTSGGLLIAVAEGDLPQLSSRLNAAGEEGHVIGWVDAGSGVTLI